MRKGLAITVTASLLLLLATKSLYVEELELYSIMVSAFLTSWIVNKNRGSILVFLGSSVLIGFIMCGVLGMIDLTVDHFLYFQPRADEDGMPLTLPMKWQEFGDDLFAASTISAVTVTTLSAMTMLISRFRKNVKRT
ncbi:hypothetical protein [Paenibacillus soyae]|uniref:Uncharacterized protein n=1 Tax=Paenibacillus soyae TaxID=2969249 RepID=A0A9X2SD86_9BACL|nr:hypothetical protein [Paenibacillus soyae]MCR2807623.1 hypothetical protein [Paenibacillus soyae]